MIVITDALRVHRRNFTAGSIINTELIKDLSPLTAEVTVEPISGSQWVRLRRHGASFDVRLSDLATFVARLQRTSEAAK